MVAVYGRCGVFVIAASVCIGHQVRAEVATIEVQPAFAVPVTGHSRFGNGHGIAARLSYVPAPEWQPFDVAVEADYACMDVSGSTDCWGRALFGAGAGLTKWDRVQLRAYAMAGVDYIGENKLGAAGLLSIGPRYVVGRLVAGASVDLLYSYVHGVDTENGNSPDPTGMLIRIDASIGLRW